MHADTHAVSLSLISNSCWVTPARLVDLSEAVSYEGVELDSCLLEETARGAVLPDDQDALPTNDPAHLPVVPPTHLSTLTPGALMVIIYING